MQIVIDIPEKDYIYIAKKHCLPSCDDRTLRKNVYEMIANGTPLPKGHGRLIDESDLIPDSDYEDGMFYAVSIGVINGASTIIEADKTESEE